MASGDTLRVSEIHVERELYPDDPSYPFPKGVGKTEESKIDYWYQKIVEEFETFPTTHAQGWTGGQTAAGGMPWFPENTPNGDTFKTLLEKTCRTRIRNFKSSNDNVMWIM